MDKILVIKLAIISTLFLIFTMYLFLNLYKLHRQLKKIEQGKPMNRKILKRKDSNIYELRTSRQKK
jgi:uncharacterized protein YoxC